MTEDDEPFSEDEDMDSDEEDGIAISSDPYAGIFFSKDRVEKVIEAVEVEEIRKVEVEFTEYEVGVLGRGAWMSGCPEQGKQEDYIVVEANCRGTAAPVPAVFPNGRTACVPARLWDSLGARSPRLLLPFREFRLSRSPSSKKCVTC